MVLQDPVQRVLLDLQAVEVLQDHQDPLAREQQARAGLLVHPVRRAQRE